MNKFKYGASSTLVGLEKNKAHQFALSHSMMLHSKNALYSFIPKNACSTLRLSVAIYNGFVEDTDHRHWIHANNHTFNATLGEAIKTDYTFVILRCPFRRLASVFLDKFVAKEPDAWQYRSLLDYKVKLDDLTFREFVFSLQDADIIEENIHWREQSAFLIYQQYSDYFSLEQLPKAIKTLKQTINFDVVDARSLTSHGTGHYDSLNDQSYADIAAFDIALMKRSGQCPSHESLYDKELIEVVKELYEKDLELYVEKFGKSDLLF
ncbi:sulfotransferase family 2 domain-containing protein [Leucothrix arctica]|uniref:Sulfotransferase family protein n=1 Tax=Leucothrix arctica TaxID=1481894 RepID=A0A317CIU3_9GAMM|nr:sulfotransferase family 2 domain-containing protein [Leucothrix arctica]PWQ96242.1 hypothetical protein DKT75_09625 [Leucothrix arctica]